MGMFGEFVLSREEFIFIEIMAEFNNKETS
jgi:hypothetical protein